MNATRGDRVVPILLSVLIHALLVGALVWGWWRYHTPKPALQTLAIEATVVRNPPPQPPAPIPPTPDAALQAQQAHEAAQAAEAKAQQERLDAEAAAHKVADEKLAAEKAVAQKAADDKAAQEAEERRVAAEQAAAEKAEAERKAKELAERKAKEAERKADEQLAQERTQSEADLRSALAAEEHLRAVESSPAKAEYLALITASINRRWHRPASARAGVKCVVHITQVPGGAITHVSVEGCNGDEAVSQSVQTAVYSASPLPAPADAALFDPNITVTFAPDD